MIKNEEIRKNSMKFETKYGGFNDAGDEYIIKSPFTPKPWINVLTNGDFGAVIAQSGGGFTWKEHSEFNRLTRWHQDLVQDNWGQFFYIRDNETGEFWSPIFSPTKTVHDSYQCRHGLGFTEFTTEYKGIKVTATTFIPRNHSLQIWHFALENKRNTDANLSLFTYFEWVLGSSADAHREFHKSFLETEYDESISGITATKRLWEIPLGDRGHWNIEYEYYGYFCSPGNVAGYEGDKDAFIGQYGDIAAPKAVKEGKLTGKVGKWNDSIASLQVDAKLAPGGQKAIPFFLGLVKDTKTISSVLKDFDTDEKIFTEFHAVNSFWKEMLSTLKVETPDSAMDLALNTWFRYQAIAGRLWGRTAYYQQSGAFGFRDQLQDSLVFLPINPEFTKRQIQLHARHQFFDGTVLHWWHPISETGLLTKMTDDLLWLPYIIGHYIDETADYSILDVKEPYYDAKDKDETLYEHCLKAIAMVNSRMSERGIPLIGAGDWNDGLSAVGLDFKGESVWLAHFFAGILNRFSEIASQYEKNVMRAKEFTNQYVALKENINQHSWDGEYFYRGTKDSGEKFGSSENEDGKIFLNAQTWSVINDTTTPERKQQVMDAVTKHLLRDNGALLLAPAYSKPDKYIGYLSRYAAGRRENGGVYTHAATWAIWAYAMVGNKELAYEAYRRLNPIVSGMNPDKYVAEPYVTPGNIDGPDSPNYGMGGWTWYTGSASWFVKCTLESILGIKPTIQGLVIEPCVPVDWKGYSVSRLFRGATYNITFVAGGGSGEVQSILFDGKILEGTTLPVAPSGSTVNVNVKLV